MRSKILGVFVAMFAFATSIQASPIVNLGHYFIPQNSSQLVSLLVSDSGNASAEDIEGMTFTLQIGLGSGTAPAISSVDFLNSTIWTGHVSLSNITAASGGTDPQFESYSLITDNGGDFVNANGILANVLFDTTNAAATDYTLKLIGTNDPASDSQFTDGVGDPVASTFGSGTLTVTSVPEPASLSLAFASTLLLLRRRNAAR